MYWVGLDLGSVSKHSDGVAAVALDEYFRCFYIGRSRRLPVYPVSDVELIEPCHI